MTKFSGFGSRPSAAAEVGTRLAQRQVERRRLVGPAAVVARDLGALRLARREEVDPVELARELVEGAGVGEAVGWPVALLADVVDRVVDDVFADALRAAAAQLDHRGQPFELAHLQLEPFEGALLRPRAAGP